MTKEKYLQQTDTLALLLYCFDAVHDHIIILDCDFKTISANQQARDFFIVHENSQNCNSLSFERHLNPLLTESVRASLKRGLSCQIRQEKINDFDSMLLPIQWSIRPLHDKNNNIIAFLFIGHPENRFQSYLKELSECMPGNFYWKDREGRYLGGNQAIFKATNLTENELIGKLDDEIWQGEAEVLRSNDLFVMESRTPINFEESVLLNDETHYFAVVKMPLRDERGNIVGVIGNSLDITELKSTQKSLREALKQAKAASSSKSEFIANMSHDLRTPMHGIGGVLGEIPCLVDDIRQAYAAGNTRLAEELLQQTADYAKMAESSAQTLTDFFNEILETCQLEAGHINKEFQAFDLYATVQKSIQLLQAATVKKHLDLSCTIHFSVPQRVIGAEHLLQRILTNLLSNALKFTEQGSVQLRLDQPESWPSSIKITEDKVVLRLCIQDTGIGIPKEELERIFDHFYRLTLSYEGKYDGAGLGLYAVKQYVKTMGGMIEVDSTLGKGSCFSVYIPFQKVDAVGDIKTSSNMTDRKAMPPQAEQTASPKGQPAATQPPPSVKTTVASTPIASEEPATASVHVLLVEDNVIAAKATQIALKRLDCAVDWIEDGAEAIEQVCANHYDLILMDVGLPGLNGNEAIRRIRALTDRTKAHVKIVSLTGHAGNKNKRQDCLDAGADHVVGKPIDRTGLEDVLRQCGLHEPEAE